MNQESVFSNFLGNVATVAQLCLAQINAPFSHTQFNKNQTKGACSAMRMVWVASLQPIQRGEKVG